nr:hypothetical protein [Burkholderia seminalis]
MKSPPSASSVAPVTALAWSDARNSAARAIVVGRQLRERNIRRDRREDLLFRHPAACRKLLGGGTPHLQPMWMLFARMPRTPTSRVR